MKKGKNVLWLFLSVFLMSGCAKSYVSIDDITIPVYEETKTLPQKEVTKGIRVDLYEMDLHLDDKEHRLSGEVKITLTNHTEKALDRICLRNDAATILGDYGEACLFDGKTENGETLTLEEGNDASIVYVLLLEELSPEESMTFSFAFINDVPKAKERFGYWKEGEDISYQLSFCFPRVAMYEEGVWNTSPYVERGESNYHTMTNFDIQLEVPKNYTVVATGDEKVEGNITHIQANNVREMAMSVATNRIVETIEVDGVKIHYYGFDHENVKPYQELSHLAARDSLQLFSKYFGEYLYEELDVVEVYSDFAMEYPGLVMIGYPDVEKIEDISLEKGFGPEVVSTTAHEVAHQWFYGAIGSDPYKEPWLDEAFAEYCEQVLYQQSGMESVQKSIHEETSIWGIEPEETWEKYMEFNVAYEPRFPIHLAYEEYDADSYFTVYDSGYCFLYELQKAMGDGAFFAMMREYYQTYQGKEVTTKDFLEAVRIYSDTKEGNKECKAVIEKYFKE